MIDHALAALNGLGGQAWLGVDVQYGLGAVYLTIRDSGHVASATPAVDGAGVVAGKGTAAGTTSTDSGPLDPLEAARIICARRGGVVGWDQGDQLLLEAWLPAGTGAP